MEWTNKPSNGYENGRTIAVIIPQSCFFITFDNQGPEWDVEVSEHAERSRKGAAGSPQATSGMCLLARQEEICLRTIMCHVYKFMCRPLHRQSEANNTAMFGKLMNIASKWNPF